MEGNLDGDAVVDLSGGVSHVVVELGGQSDAVAEGGIVLMYLEDHGEEAVDAPVVVGWWWRWVDWLMVGWWIGGRLGGGGGLGGCGGVLSWVVMVGWVVSKWLMKNRRKIRFSINHSNSDTQTQPLPNKDNSQKNNHPLIFHTQHPTTNSSNIQQQQNHPT